MTCPEFRDLLSSRLDGDLTQPQRVRLEAHLQACAACRRSAAQLERAVLWLRGLERLPAPARAARLAHLPRRRSAWVALRPVALAASAVLAALLAWEGFDALVAPSLSVSTQPTAPREERASGEGRSAASSTTASPARGSQGLPSHLGPAPASQAAGEVDLPAAAAPQKERPVSSIAPHPTGNTPAEEPVYARIHGGSPPDADGEPPSIAEDAAAAEPSPDPASAVKPPEPVATMAWVVQPHAGTPAPPAPEPSARGSRPPAVHTSPAPAPAKPGPVATEVATSVPVVAWVDADAIRFGDAGDPEPGELLTARDPDAATEGAPATDLRRMDEAPRPDADPRTGVIPPVPIERPRAILPEAPDPEVWRVLPSLSLQVTVAADGRVVSASALPWPGPRWVAEALTKAVRGWTFRPAERAGTAIAARLEVAIEFDAR